MPTQIFGMRATVEDIDGNKFRLSAKISLMRCYVALC